MLPSAAIALGALLVLATPNIEEGKSDVAAYRLIDMVVAQVDSTVITFSELVSETRLVLLRTGGPELARAGTLSQGLLAAVLRSIVVRELILGEVRRLKLRDVPETEVKKAIDGVKVLFPSSADYQRFLEKSGFSEPGSTMVNNLDAPASLVAVVNAEIQVERFLDIRVRRNIAVRESEVVLCYEANKVRIGRPYQNVRDQVRLRLEEQRAERGMVVLVDGLERRATVRYAPNFEPPPKADEAAQMIGIVCPETEQRQKGETEP